MGKAVAAEGIAWTDQGDTSSVGRTPAHWTKGRFHLSVVWAPWGFSWRVDAASALLDHGVRETMDEAKAACEAFVAEARKV